MLNRKQLYKLIPPWNEDSLYSSTLSIQNQKLDLLSNDSMCMSPSTQLTLNSLLHTAPSSKIVSPFYIQRFRNLIYHKLVFQPLTKSKKLWNSWFCVHELLTHNYRILKHLRFNGFPFLCWSMMELLYSFHSLVHLHRNLLSVLG